MAHFRQPEEICQIDAVIASYQALAGQLKPVGTLRWIISPEERNIAGWPWKGYTLQYQVALNDGEQVNKLRQFATWEIGGRGVGLTTVAQRYRGLGGVEETFTAHVDGGVAEAFSTTEVIPGAVGGAPVVSPIVPASVDIGDRGYALKHRMGAWIAQMARGGGANFVDWQWRDNTLWMSSYDRQGNFRALSEAMPGDQGLSYTDSQYFPLSDSFTTEPQLFLTLQTEQAIPKHDMRSRWQEVDQDVRDRVAQELNFVQYEVQPGVGLLTDVNWTGVYKQMVSSSADFWGKSGVRKLAYHNPGWINGRYQGPGGPPDTGGGVCEIYDWVPTNDLLELWPQAMKKFEENNIAYYPWIGQTVTTGQLFTQRVGSDKKYWSLNGPHDALWSWLRPQNSKGNIYNNTFRQEFTGTLDQTRDNYGFNGFWIDSFQNLMMTQLAWSDGSGNSLQRGWWEWLAEWSRKGVATMAESHAFPGLSCSLEVGALKHPDSPYYYQHVFRWMRGTEQSHFSPEELDRIAFQIMANKGWLAPDISRTHTDLKIPSFAEYAHSFNTAQPDMRRSNCLPNNAGVIWRNYKSDNRAILFSFIDQDVPQGIQAYAIQDDNKTPVSSFEHQTVYVVTGDELSLALLSQPLHFKIHGWDASTKPPATDMRPSRLGKPTLVWPICVCLILHNGDVNTCLP